MRHLRILMAFLAITLGATNHVWAFPKKESNVKKKAAAPVPNRPLPSSGRRPPVQIPTGNQPSVQFPSSGRRPPVQIPTGNQPSVQFPNSGQRAPVQIPGG